MPKTPREDLYVQAFIRPNKTEDVRTNLPKLNQRFIGESVHKEVVHVTDGVNISGHEVEDEDAMAAKRVSNGSDHRFYLRFENGKVMDPYALSFKHEDLLNAKVVRGKLRYEFREVDAKVYVIYLEYLKSRATRYLNQIEGILNG